jgi:SOS response regulatory protein OraA/RecX
MEMQFEKTHYDDWFFDDTKKANKILEGKRAVLRAELEQQGIPDKQIDKILKKRFPLLKDIKDPDSKK